MKWDLRLRSVFAAKARALIKAAEAAVGADQQLQSVAGEVFVGDVYALREEMTPCGDKGWGKRCYVCEAGTPPL